MNTTDKKTQLPTNGFAIHKAVQQSPSAIVITDVNGYIEYVNPKFTQMTGYTPAEIKGKKPSILKSGHTTQAEYEELWQTVLSGKEWHGDFFNRRKDGTHYWERASISPVFDENGDIKNFVAVKEDITARIESERKVQQLNADLRAMNEQLEQHVEERTQQLQDVIKQLQEVQLLKDSFVSMISHEIRTPITAIALSVGMLQRYYNQYSDEKRLAKIEQIHRQTTVLNELVDAVVGLSRIEDVQPDKVTSIHISQATDSVIGDLCGMAEDKHQQFHVQTWEDYESCQVNIKEADIKQIWRNLIGNAIKYTPAGGQVHVNIGHMHLNAKPEPDFDGVNPFELTSPMPEGDYFVGQVVDNGYGIPEDDQALIFDRFYRGWARSTTISGTGLGLSLVKEALTRYGGDIVVQSQPGHGSSFSFYLPCACQ